MKSRLRYLVVWFSTLNPQLRKRIRVLTLPFYLLESAVLVALSASLFQSLTISYLRRVPKFSPSKEYPYREASGRACFVCESDQELVELGSSDCPHCSPSVALDLSQGQRVLKHVGAHILNVNLEQTPQNWVCAACEVSGKERGGKRVRR